MLRIIFILNICLISLNISAQNWELFPIKQLNHYRVDGDNPEIRSFQADSIVIRGESIVHLFRNYMNFSSECYWQNFDFFYYTYFYDDYFQIKSLEYVGDSVFYNDPSSLDFVFKPWAKPGEQWSLSSHFNRKGTCISAGVMDILGEIDSVKIYTLQTAVEDVTFILSKIHGFIQFVPFDYFFMELPLEKSTFPTYYLLGTQSNTKTRGFKYPDFSDYFHLSVGDILFWRYNFYDHLDDKTHYYYDSIPSSYISSDTVIYNIHRDIYDISGKIIESRNINDKYYRILYENILKAPSKWYYINYEGSEELNVIDNFILYYTENDSAFTREARSIDCYFTGYNEESCQIVCLTSDWDNRLSFSTIEGLTYLKYSFYYEQILLGSVINGVERGSIELPLGLETSDLLPVYVYPNPAKSVIYLNNQESGISRVELYNSLGSRLFSIKFCHEIDVSAYPAGCYHLIIFSATGKIYTQKLILAK